MEIPRNRQRKDRAVTLLGTAVEAKIPRFG